MLQAHFRGHLARKEWQRKRQAVILLQAYTRGMLARRALNKTKRDVRTRVIRSPNTCCILMCWLFLLRGLSVGDTLSVYLIKSQQKVLQRATLGSQLHKFCHFKLNRSNELTLAASTLYNHIMYFLFFLLWDTKDSFQLLPLVL